MEGWCRKGVGRLTQIERSRSTKLEPDIQKSWSRARAVAATAQGWISHNIQWL